MRSMMAVMLLGTVCLHGAYGQKTQKAQAPASKEEDMVMVRVGDPSDQDAARTRATSVPVSELRVPSEVMKELQRSDKALFDGDRLGAITHLENAVAMDPELAVAHNALGVRYTEAGEFEKALREFQKALAANPRYHLAVDNIAGVYCLQHRWPEAETVARRALDLEPEAKSSQYILGAVLVQEGHYVGEATKLLENVKGKYVRAWMFLGQAALGRGNTEEAIEDVKQYLRSPAAKDIKVAEEWLTELQKEEAEASRMP